ncbi:MAG: protein-L-isoaspartate(D-aspartate) O-methyltransferase [Burkholderiaceae bacterium]|nr:protein-L-isoaspartate(D-aspartate) O-methyltransferase [Burkholderiaceae bacterium]
MAGTDDARRAYAQLLVRELGPGHDRLCAAFAATPREDFLGPPPWPLLGGFTRQWTDDARELYQDVLVGLDVELGINNGQPSLHAHCLAACDPQPGDTALHVGAGTGYYSAILAHLVGAQGRVLAYEIVPHLAERAAHNLAAWPQVRVRATSGAEPPQPACDVIYVSAGATHPVPAWLDAMRIGARLVFPLTADDGGGCMLLVTRRSERGYAARALMRVNFIACIGARHTRQSQALREAFASRPERGIRSLRRDDAPDDSAWVAGPGWWLSSDEPVD